MSYSIPSAQDVTWHIVTALLSLAIFVIGSEKAVKAQHITYSSTCTSLYNYVNQEVFKNPGRYRHYYLT